MKKLILFIALAMISVVAAAKDYIINTANTTLVISAKEGKQAKYVYYGPRIVALSDVRNTSTAVNSVSYPCFGTNCTVEHAMSVIHSDGDTSLNPLVRQVDEYTDPDGGMVMALVMTDEVHPFTVIQYFKAYEDCDVIKTWTECFHKEKKPVLLTKFASGYVPVRHGDHWLTYLAGGWAAETQLVEEKINRGRKMLGNHDGARTSFTTNPSFMVSLDGRPQEDRGNVLGGTLAYTGNYDISFVKNSSNFLDIVAGINPECSQYWLKPKEKFVTPELVLTYSTQGKGGVSRNFHRWGRKYNILDGEKQREILLNSWEGVYFKVSQGAMNDMMRDFSEIGGELFVMDDGWFGDKYPRNNSKTSLGDWTVCEAKLPGGVDGLIAEADRRGLKFGIWIEPEMTNVTSELYEKHPDWVLRQPDREPKKGRGGTQLMLDLCNPKVQDHVFSVIDNLMKSNPRIYYMKWDANCSIHNAYSQYLPKDRQTHIYIEYHRGLKNTLERIRAKYPELVIQLCASGGGRLSYGYMPYFQEVWASDNTDALQRLYIQCGFSHFYPANIMASHVSASPNHQTKREVPLKFRFDVAMTGRLGMEMKPSALNEKERKFAAEAIETYKSIRPVIQQGDLYRLASPYDGKPYVSLMYVTPEKDRAVFFLFRTTYLRGEQEEFRKMAGLAPDRMYRIRELNVADPKKKVRLDGKTVSGKYLMDMGALLALKGELTSTVLELTAVK